MFLIMQFATFTLSFYLLPLSLYTSSYSFFFPAAAAVFESPAASLESFFIPDQPVTMIILIIMNHIIRQIRLGKDFIQLIPGLLETRYRVTDTATSNSDIEEHDKITSS
jgi:hypothetical protein